MVTSQITVGPDNSPAIDFLYETGLDENKYLRDSVNRINTGTGLVVGFLLLSTVQILNLVISKTPLRASGVPITVQSLTFLGLGFSVLAALVALKQLAPKGLMSDPSLPGLTQFVTKTPAEIRATCIDPLQKAINHNRSALKSVAQLSRWVFALSSVAVAAYAMGGLILIWTSLQRHPLTISRSKRKVSTSDSQQHIFDNSNEMTAAALRFCDLKRSKSQCPFL